MRSGSGWGRAGGDGEVFQVGRPRRFGREPAPLMAGEPRDQRSRKLAGAHVVQRRRVDRIVPEVGAQQVEEVASALGECGRKPGEALVADAGADAVAIGVPGAGIVHRDPRRRLKAGPQNSPVLIEKAVLPRDQQPHHLTLGDVYPEVPQQARQAFHGDLALMILGQHEAPHLRAEMTHDPPR